jgi:hypothetical protein
MIPPIGFQEEKLMFTHKEDRDVQSLENKIEERREPEWDFMFKLNLTGEELETAVRLFAAQCWDVSSTNKIQAIRRTPGCYDLLTGQEVPGQEGDSTWLVTDGERHAWITRYGPNHNEIPIWSVNIED